MSKVEREDCVEHLSCDLNEDELAKYSQEMAELNQRKVEVEGERGLVGEFIKQLRIGPRSAHVTGLDIEELDPAGDYDGFEIRF